MERLIKRVVYVDINSVLCHWNQFCLILIRVQYFVIGTSSVLFLSGYSTLSLAPVLSYSYHGTVLCHWHQFCLILIRVQYFVIGTSSVLFLSGYSTLSLAPVSLMSLIINAQLRCRWQLV